MTWKLVPLLSMLAWPSQAAACDFEPGIHFTRPWSGSMLPANAVVFADMWSHGAPSARELDVVFLSGDEAHPVSVRLHPDSNDLAPALAEMSLPESAIGLEGTLRIVHVDGAEEGNRVEFRVSTERDTEPPVLSGAVEVSFEEYNGPEGCCDVPLSGDAHRITATFLAAEDDQDVTAYLLFERSERGDRFISHRLKFARDQIITISAAVIRQEAECYKVIALDHAGNRSAPISNCEPSMKPEEPPPVEPPEPEPPSPPSPGALSLEEGHGCSCVPRPRSTSIGILGLLWGVFASRSFLNGSGF